MTMKPNPRNHPSLHDDWLAGSSSEVETPSPPKPRAEARRAPTPPPSEDDWLGQLDHPEDHPAPKVSKPPAGVKPALSEPDEPTERAKPSKRPARRVISHALAWAGGMGAGFALSGLFRPAPTPVVIPPPVVATTVQESKPAISTPAPQGDTRPVSPVVPLVVAPIAPPPVIPTRPPEATPVPTMPPAPAERPTPPPSESTPAPPPRPQPTRPNPSTINYDDYRSPPPPPRR